MIYLNQCTPPLIYDHLHIIYRIQEAVCIVGSCQRYHTPSSMAEGQKGMWMLEPDTGVPFCSDVDKVRVAGKEKGVMIHPPSSGSDFDVSYALVLEASMRYVTIYDVGLDEEVARMQDMSGNFFYVKVDLLCTDPPYNVVSRQNRSN